MPLLQSGIQVSMVYLGARFIFDHGYSKLVFEILLKSSYITNQKIISKLSYWRYIKCQN